jgi:hypothetical protein
MLRLRLTTTAMLLVALVAISPALADEPFRYPQAKQGRGELRYVNGVPVLLVGGAPAETGEQIGVLALKPATVLTKLVDQFIKANGWERLYPVLLKTGNIMLPQFPPDHLAELEAAAKASGWSRDGYPGMLGCTSAMNDAGLALAELTVTTAADDSPALNVAGVPFTLAFRRVMEECRTVEEAEKLLRSLKRTVRQNVAICDRRRAAVFEITPKSLVVRPAESGLCACTNHFRTQGLATQTDCPRYAALVKGQGTGKLTVADVARQMDAVNQGDWTLQTMVFEPAALKLHLAYGKGPATRLPLHTLELKSLFAAGQESK